MPTACDRPLGPPVAGDHQSKRSEDVPPRDRRTSAPAGQAADDFQQIQGIGAAIERRLHDAGIRTYTDLAALTPEQIAASLAGVAGLSATRIASQDWGGQAGRLAGPAAPALPSEPDQRYASFHVEFLLDVDGGVRRTKVHHHQSGTDEAWAGWDEDRLLALLRDHIPLVAARQPVEAAVLPPSAAPAAAELGPAPSAAQAAEPGPPGPSAAEPEPAARSAAQLDKTVPSEDQPDTAIPSRAGPDTAVPSRAGPETADLPVGLSSSSLRIDYLGLTREGQRSRTWAPGEPTSVGFTLQVGRTDTLEADTLDFTADVTASSTLGDDQRWPLGTVQGAVQVGEPLLVELTGEPLPRGLYRAEATVLIYSTNHAVDSEPLQGRRASGALIQVA
jgi:predicted flap endonuclease-1-like 5' DNA nuclease